MIDFIAVEQRKPPTADDITKAVKQVGKLPDDGDAGKVLSLYPFYPKALPVISGKDWAKSKQKLIKLKKLQGSTARISRSNLVWHVKHPGQSKFAGRWNTHVQCLQTKGGDIVIIDGHHRAAALKLLNVKRDSVWLLKESDL